MSLDTRQVLHLADTTIAILSECSPYNVGYIERLPNEQGQTITYFAYFEGEIDPAVTATYEDREWPRGRRSTIRSASIYCDPDALEDYISFLDAALTDPSTYGEAFKQCSRLPKVQPDKINLMAVS